MVVSEHRAQRPLRAGALHPRAQPTHVSPPRHRLDARRLRVGPGRRSRTNRRAPQAHSAQPAMDRGRARGPQHPEPRWLRRHPLWPARGQRNLRRLRATLRPGGRSGTGVPTRVETALGRGEGRAHRVVHKPPRRGAPCPGTTRPSGSAPRPVPESATTHGSIRLVRRQRPCRGRVPARYEIRLMVDLPARERCANARRVRGWDPGGRRSLTSDAGDVIQVRTRAKTEHRRLARRISRCKRGSRGYRKAKAALRLHLERETRARDQHRHKQIHHGATKADVHVVEFNRHATMRRRGGKSKSRMNRSLAEAGPAMTVQLLRHQCERHGKHLIEAPAPYNSRTCAVCGSRETKLTRARIACTACGHTADRDANAAANALNWARTNGAVPAPGGSNREVSARRGSSRAPQCPVPPESLGPATALARREPGKLPGQRNRKDFCPCPNPQEMCPNGQNSC